MEISKEQILEQTRQIPQWRHRIALPHGVVTLGKLDTEKEWARYNVSDSLEGRRVLDIGCSDGFYSFECEKRGAEFVLAIDDESSHLAGGNNGFQIVKSILNSKAEYLPLSIYDLDPDQHGRFDEVFFLNVLYHLRYPLLGLDRIHAVMNPGGVMYFKSFYEFDYGTKIFGRRVGFGLNRRPWARFYPNTELAGDPTNWWGPNIRCIRDMLMSSGFIIEKDLGRTYDRVYLQCRRK